MAERNALHFLKNGCEIIGVDVYKRQPLTFVDVPDNQTYSKNTAPLEADEIVKYAAMNKDKKIAVITPFANQRELINEKLKENGLSNISCRCV